jgi:hypothetical protein
MGKTGPAGWSRGCSESRALLVAGRGRRERAAEGGSRRRERWN